MEISDSYATSVPHEEQKVVQQVQTMPTASPSYYCMEGSLAPSNASMINGAMAYQMAVAQAPNRLHMDDPDAYYPGEKRIQGCTIFLFGGLGTWKTTFAGTFPKCVFLSIGPEGGDDALAMLPSLYGIPAPPTFTITSVAKMREKVDYIVANYKRLDINTVVIDSITTYIDMWIASLLETRIGSTKARNAIEAEGILTAAMQLRDWSLLDMDIRANAMKLHKTALNVIWIAMEKEIKESDGQNSSRVIAVEPAIKGEQKAKLPALCKMVIHAFKTLMPDPNVPGRMMVRPVFYTSPNGLTRMIRHKYGHAFPEGKLVDPQYGDVPTFNAIWSRIGNFVYAT